jgi:hypothetical protein
LDKTENDIRVIGVSVGDIENKDEWKLKTRVADPK